MSLPTRELEDVLKVAENAASLLNHSMLCADSSGILKKRAITAFPIHLGSVTDTETISKIATIHFFLTSDSTLNLPPDITTNYGVGIFACFSETNGIILWWPFQSKSALYCRQKFGGNWKDWWKMV